VASARQVGLRLQIVLALGGLMVLAFVPLFFAVASLARATVWGVGEQSARALARSMAAHVDDAGAWDGTSPASPERGRNVGADGTSAMRGALEMQVEGLEQAGVLAACVFGSEGAPPICAGAPGEAAAIRADREPVSHVQGPVVQVHAHTRGGALVLRMRVDDATTRTTPLVRLVALYMTTFALALIVFAYFSLTRLIVRPVDELVRAADRVATGARSLRVPRTGPRELAELAASVQAMAERLIAEEATLELRVEELTHTTTRLTQTQAQLVRSERLASVGRLAAGLAHEIGNPIAALAGMQDLMLDGDLPPETQRDFLQRMRRETDRIHVVLRDLLDFARPEKARDSGESGSPAAVRAVLEDVAALMKPQKAFRSVEVSFDVQGEPLVALPAPQLTQVLLNVMLNAGDAVASAKKEAGRVVARVRQEGERVRIEVEDNGPGVALEVQGRLFEPFVTTKPTGEGTGLGLAVCRGLVESAGGTIAVDPAFHDGARFIIELPVS
jgi:signal transduction histidine kinase